MNIRKEAGFAARFLPANSQNRSRRDDTGCRQKPNFDARWHGSFPLTRHPKYRIRAYVPEPGTAHPQPGRTEQPPPGGFDVPS